MANNPYVNKIEYAGQTLIDLTNDTVSSSTLLDGQVAHDASGQRIVGAMMQNPVTVNNGSVSKISGTDDDYQLTLS